ncbi:MAG: hypothetical protein RLZZ122_163, partial [Actinomycetota bacterium]
MIQAATSAPTRRQLRLLEQQSKVSTGSLRRFLTVVSTTGLMATVALPSYGFSPEATAVSGLTVNNEL